MTHPTELIGSVFANLLQETCMHLCIERIYSQMKAILYIFELMHVSFSKIIFNRKTIKVIYSTKLY